MNLYRGLAVSILALMPVAAFAQAVPAASAPAQTAIQEAQIPVAPAPAPQGKLSVQEGKDNPAAVKAVAPPQIIPISPEEQALEAEARRYTVMTRTATAKAEYLLQQSKIKQAEASIAEATMKMSMSNSLPAPPQMQNGGGQMQGQAPIPVKVAPPAPPPVPAPGILAIRGAGSAMEADLSNGQWRRTVRMSDASSLVLPDESRVLSISLNGVVLRDKSGRSHKIDMP